MKSASHYTETAVDEMKLLQMVCTHFGRYLTVITISSYILLDFNIYFYVYSLLEFSKRMCIPCKDNLRPAKSFNPPDEDIFMPSPVN